MPVFTEENQSAQTIAANAITYAKKFARDIVILDTAGRTTIDEDMMKEVKEVSEIAKPTEVLFVCDSMIGQDAVNTAKAFNDLLKLTGVVLTKIDGDTRGGAALSVLSVVGAPIKFVGTGEKVDDLEPFHPDRIASRILGMGDVVSFVEKIEQEVDEKAAEELEQKIKKNQFTFDDFLDQIKMVKKMGSIKDLLGMLPGMDKRLKGVDVDDNAFKKIESVIFSMTKQERTNPKILNGSRRQRIARGSGSTVQDVNKLIKQFEDIQKMMKSVAQGKKSNMLTALKRMGLG
jgi:signal recognition particle subunit SRP54